MFAPAAVAELLELMNNLPDTADFTTQVCVLLSAVISITLVR